jgi:hypothetical protein
VLFLVPWIETECDITYESRSGLIALWHRLGMEHRKPRAVSSKLDPDKQAAFIKEYERTGLGMTRPSYLAMRYIRRMRCGLWNGWAPKDTPVAVEQTSGRQRLNIHGAISRPAEPV